MTEEIDYFKRLKHVAYCRVHGVTTLDADTLGNFVDIAKFNLCDVTKTLWKDPVWDTYSDEDILVEYFSYKFKIDSDFTSEFESDSGISANRLEDAADWMDEMIAANEAELQDDLSLTAEELGGE